LSAETPETFYLALPEFCRYLTDGETSRAQAEQFSRQRSELANFWIALRALPNCKLHRRAEDAALQRVAAKKEDESTMTGRRRLDLRLRDPELHSNDY
jgi:hypothetical protein